MLRPRRNRWPSGRGEWHCWLAQQCVDARTNEPSLLGKPSVAPNTIADSTEVLLTGWALDETEMLGLEEVQIVGRGN